MNKSFLYHTSKIAKYYRDVTWPGLLHVNSNRNYSSAASQSVHVSNDKMGYEYIEQLKKTGWTIRYKMFRCPIEGQSYSGNGWVRKNIAKVIHVFLEAGV